MTIFNHRLPEEARQPGVRVNTGIEHLTTGLRFLSVDKARKSVFSGPVDRLHGHTIVSGGLSLAGLISSRPQAFINKF
jgi:hypothetical protein